MAEWPDQDPFTASWLCKLPVRVCLNPNSISSPTALPPFYVLAARQSYVSSISSQTWSMVQHVLPKLPGNVQPKPWFDHQGIPLKSTLTIGVLYDLLSPDTTGVTAVTSDASSPLPWHLTMHYTHAPADVSASWLMSLPPQTHFMNSLKEACHICKGADGSAAVMRLDGAVQDALWAAVEKCDVKQYRSHLAALKVIPSPKAQGSAPPSLPVRLLLRQAQPPGAAAAAGSPNVWDSIVCTSRPVPSRHPSGAWVTLADTLHALLPSMFPAPPAPPGQPADSAAQADSSTPPQPSAVAGGEQAGMQSDVAADQVRGETAGDGAADPPGQAATHGDGGEEAGEGGTGRQEAEQDDTAPESGGQEGGGTEASSTPIAAAADTADSKPEPAPDKPKQLTLPLNVVQTAGGGSVMVASPQQQEVPGGDAGGSSEGASRCRCLVGGVQPPLDTPLAWLHAQMHAPDYFLYLVLRADGGGV